jgi:hypothetical protein
VAVVAAARLAGGRVDAARVGRPRTGHLARLPTDIAVPLALVACLADLVAVQIAVLRRGGPRSAGRIAATIALDAVAGAVVPAVLTLLR